MYPLTITASVAANTHGTMRNMIHDWQPLTPTELAGLAMINGRPGGFDEAPEAPIDGSRRDINQEAERTSSAEPRSLAAGPAEFQGTLDEGSRAEVESRGRLWDRAKRSPQRTDDSDRSRALLERPTGVASSLVGLAEAAKRNSIDSGGNANSETLAQQKPDPERNGSGTAENGTKPGEPAEEDWQNYKHLRCRIEKNLYLAFEQYAHYTCANCYK